MQRLLFWRHKQTEVLYCNFEDWIVSITQRLILHFASSSWVCFNLQHETRCRKTRYILIWKLLYQCASRTFAPVQFSVDQCSFRRHCMDTIIQDTWSIYLHMLSSWKQLSKCCQITFHHRATAQIRGWHRAGCQEESIVLWMLNPFSFSWNSSKDPGDTKLTSTRCCSCTFNLHMCWVYQIGFSTSVGIRTDRLRTGFCFPNWIWSCHSQPRITNLILFWINGALRLSWWGLKLVERENSEIF